MKYIVLGYMPGKYEDMSESERNAMFDECFTYDLEERKGCSDRRSVRGDEGAIGWNSGA